MQAIRLGELAVEFAKHLSSMSNLFHVDCKHEAAADKAEDTFAKRIWHRAKSAPKALESGGLGFPIGSFLAGCPTLSAKTFEKDSSAWIS
jgi:hypothetical protein